MVESRRGSTFFDSPCIDMLIWYLWNVQIFYHLYTEGGIVFSSVCLSVCLSVSLSVCLSVTTMTPEPLELLSQNYHGSIVSIYGLSTGRLYAWLSLSTGAAICLAEPQHGAAICLADAISQVTNASSILFMSKGRINLKMAVWGCGMCKW